MLKQIIFLIATATALFSMELSVDLKYLIGKWTVVVALGDYGARDGQITPSVHLHLTNYSDAGLEPVLTGDVIGFESNQKIANVACVLNHSASYDRSDYVCTFDYDDLKHYIFVNDLDSSKKYFLGEYLALPSGVLAVTYYANKETYVGVAVPRSSTVIIPMF